MPLIRPFAGLRPGPEYAADVAAPPYDVLSSAEARVRGEGRPWSFLHISKPEIDLPEGADPTDYLVYAKAVENLRQMVDAGILRRDSKPFYYVYRLAMGKHRQTGLVAVASIADYDSNRIRKHELTRPDKEDDRVRQIDVLKAQTGPVLLAYRSEPAVDEMLAAVTEARAEYDIQTDDVGHELWVVKDLALIDKISSAFNSTGALYIADGHHRSAAASRVAASRREQNPQHTGEESYNYFLSVIFPHSQMQILGYNRVVKDLKGMDSAAFLDRLSACFGITSSSEAVSPARQGEFGLYLPGQWYQLRIKEDLVPAQDPVASLDVSLLADHLLAPVLGIEDLRRDPRIDFVGGIRGLGELEKKVNSGEMAAAFSLFPTRMEALMAVADTGQVMPPKSTWFEPKLADGLVSHVLD